MIKRIYKIAIAVLILALVAMVPLYRASSERIKIDNGGNVIISSDLESSDDVTSLQFSLEIEDESGADISFKFDDSVKAKIKEYRYHEDDKCLNIYISGTEPLFDNENQLMAGTVLAQDKSGKYIHVKISALKDSLKYISGADLESKEFELETTSTYLKGDTNGDGNLDILDPVLIAKSLLGSVTLTPEQIMRADTNQDGKADVLDAIWIAKELLKKLK